MLENPRLQHEGGPPSGVVEILAKPLSQQLLGRDIARLAYVAGDGTPRVVPIAFTWNGSEVVMCTATNSPKADPPIVRLNRAVAVGEADGASAGLGALALVDDDVPRPDAVAAHLHEKHGDVELAALLYAEAARNAPNLAERDHQMRQAARLNQRLRDR